MNKYLVLLAITNCLACTKLESLMAKPRTSYKLNSGKTVSCRYAASNECGMHLWDCADGNKYTCQYNVEIKE